MKRGGPYLDVACELVRLSEGAYRVVLSFQDWAGGSSGEYLGTYADFSSEDDALVAVERAVSLFRLRKSPGRDQWRNAPSPGFRRAIWRVAGRVRRHRAQQARDGFPS